LILDDRTLTRILESCDNEGQFDNARGLTGKINNLYYSPTDDCETAIYMNYRDYVKRRRPSVLTDKIL